MAEFERGEIRRVDGSDATLPALHDAAALHFGGLSPAAKQRLAFAFHAMTVYGYEDGLFLDMLES